MLYKYITLPLYCCSPMGKERKGGDLHKFDFDIESVQRAQLLQKVWFKC